VIHSKIEIVFEFNIVFAFPHLLNNLALCNKEVIYDLFFKSAAYTLNAFSLDPKYLAAQLVFFGILHTWCQKLTYHVHINCIVTGGVIKFYLNV
jgi:hypothetical protein